MTWRENNSLHDFYVCNVFVDNGSVRGQGTSLSNVFMSRAEHTEKSLTEIHLVLCGLRVGTRGLEPPQGASGKTGPLRGL